MNIFNKIKTSKNPRNKFDLSHERKMSLNMGGLYPILLEEVVPTDSFKVKSEILIRLAPMLAPIMHRVNVYTHYFFVPNRLVWENWEDFITGGEDGLAAPVFPTIAIDETNKNLFVKGKLPDYFGIPITDGASAVTQAVNVSALPFRAYQLINNEYYRDQNLTPKLDFSLGDGQEGFPENDAVTTLRQRNWEKDYFTSALPWPQRGANVDLPVTSSFSPVYKAQAELAGAVPSSALFTNSASNLVTGSATGVAAGLQNLEDNQVVDSTSVTINELRNATRLQEWLEKMARGGSRYAEQLKSMWNSRSSDARLQRPEYLGGGKNAIVISEVLQTSASASDVQTQDTPLAEMAGHGISMGKSNGFTKTFEEHGHIIGIMSVLPRTTYSQGLERSWSRRDKLDYYWPDFAHLGEQEILSKEIYADFYGIATNDLTFGYTPRYAEYKYKQSTIHGDFRDSLSYWHMGRDFASIPALNTEFVESDPTHDIFAVTDPTIDKLYCQIYNSISAVRPMPYYGTPYL